MRTQLWLVASLLILTALGCSSEEPIRSYRVAKSAAGLESFEPAPRAKTPQDGTPTRMIVAWFEQPEQNWFFRVSGPQAEVEAQAEACQKFFESIRFEDGKPVWEAADWTPGPDKPMRFATLLIGDSTPPLEMAISRLATGQELTANLNRWRGQLGLAPLNEQDAEAWKTAQQDSGRGYWLFDEVGLGSGQMRPPFAGMTPPVQSTPRAEIKYPTPTGWKDEGRSSQMIAARLSFNSDGDVATITVIRMPAAINEWEPNVVRWGDQLGLKLTPKQIQDATQEVIVDGETGQLIELLEHESTDGIVAVMLKRDKDAWFFKLSGPKSLVQERQADFESFLNEFKF